MSSLQLSGSAKSSVYDETLSLNLLFSYIRVFLMLNTSIFPSIGTIYLSLYVKVYVEKHSNDKKNQNKFRFLKYQLRPLLFAQIILW